MVERGDNLWDISEDRLEDDLGRDATDAEVAPYWQQVIDTNQDRYVQPGNPSLILPGQVIDLPPTGHEPPPHLNRPEESPRSPPNCPQTEPSAGTRAAHLDHHDDPRHRPPRADVDNDSVAAATGRR